MPLTAEQTTIIRSSLDPSGFQRGSQAMADSAKQAGAQIEDANNRVTASVTKSTRSITDGGAAYERYKRQLDPAYASAQKFAQIQDTINRAIQAGRATQDDATRLLDAAAAKYKTTADAVDRMAGSSSQAAFAQRQLGVQTVQLFSSIQAGQPVLTAFIQQGHQILDVSLATGTGIKVLADGIKNAFGVALSAILSPLGLAITGFAAFGAAAAVIVSRSIEIESEQKTLAISLQATGRTADVSAASLQRYVDQLKQVGTSSADAMAVVNALGRNQNLNGSQIGQIVGLAPDLSTALGTDLKSAADKLADIAGGSTDALQKLNDQLHFLTPAQEAAADAALKHGDKLGAMQTVVEHLTPQIEGLHDKALSPAAKAIQDAANAWSDFVDAIARSQPVLQILQGFANTLNSISHAISGTVDINKATADLAQLQGEMSKVQTTLNGTDPNSARAKALQETLSDLQKQAAATQKQIDAALQGTSMNLPGITVTGKAPAPSQTDQASLDLARLASQRFEGSNAGQIQKYTDEIKKFQGALDQLGPRTSQNATLFDQLTGAIKADQKSLEDLTKKNEEHRTSLQKQGDTISAEIKAQQQLADAYLQGYAAVQKVLAVQDAEKKAISDGLAPGTAKYAAAVADLTKKNLALADAKGVADINKQIADTDAATQSQLAINAAYDGTAQSLQHATDYQKAYNAALRSGLTEGTPEFTKAVNDYADALDRSADAMKVFQQQQASVQAIASAFQQSFDTIGNAITQAFVQGQGEAVNWGNVMKSVVAQVIQQFMKLAVLNPLLNSLFGQSNPTLGMALSTLGGSGAVSGAGGSGVLGMGQNLLSLGGITDKLGLTNIGGSLGVTGPNGLFSGVGSFLSTPLFGTGATAAGAGIGPSTFAGAPGGFIPEGAISQAGVAANPVTIGGLLGGAGLGFGAGTLLGSLTGMRNSTGNMIGSGIGSLAGAAIGSIVPGVGTLIGGLLGGLLGSSGGLFGAPKPNEFSTTQVDVGSNGLLTLGTTTSQLAQNSDVIKAAQKSIDDLNSMLSGNGIRIGNPRSAPTNQFDDAGMIGRFGYDKGSNSTLGNAGADFSSLFPLLRFDFSQSAHPEIQSVFNDRGYINAPFSGFTDSAQLGGTITALSKLSDDLHNNAPDQWQHFFNMLINTPTDQLAAKAQQIDTFVTQTVPSLENFGKVTGSLNDQIAQINATFAPAIQMAQQLGYAEADLTKARDDAIAKAQEAANFTMDQTMRANYGGFLSASASTPQEQLNAALYNFDTQAAAQRRSLDQQLVGIYGDTVRSTAGYTAQMATLEASLGAQRLAIQKQYDDQIVQAAQQAAAARAQAETGIIANDNNLYARYLTAGAQISGDPASQQYAALYAFDVQAKAERDQFEQTLIATYGDSVKTTQGYADQMAIVDRTLAEERLAIQKQYADQALQQEQQQRDQAQQSVVSVLQSIDQYAKSIQQGSLSALSSTDQYALARQQFQAVNGAAQAGDFNSIQQLTSYANAFLTASRGVNGSGLQYATDYQAVINALQGITAKSPDQLTSSAMSVVVQKQTDTLVTVLNGVRADIQALGRKAEVNSILPGRTAA